MDATSQYNGCLTAEQFLFYEMRIVSRLYVQGNSIDEIIKMVKKDNLFQYPTERQISRLTRACYKRLVALNSDNLSHAVEFSKVPIIAFYPGSYDDKDLVLFGKFLDDHHYRAVATLKPEDVK